MFKKIAGVVVAVSFAGSASAAGALGSLTSAVDFTEVGTAVIGGMAAMAAVGVTLKGGKAVLKKLGLWF